MRSIIRMFLLLLAPAALLIHGCGPSYPIAVSGQQGMSAEAELAIKELVLRHLLTAHSDANIAFISFGASREDRVDPPIGFLDRLSDMSAQLRPVSEMGKPSNAAPPLLLLNVVARPSATDARVSATRIRFGAGGSEGFTAHVRWSAGAWKIVQADDHWST